MARRKTTASEAQESSEQQDSAEQQDLPEQQAAEVCGTTPCWSPTPTTFTNAVAGLQVTATPASKGNVSWDWGDGSDTRNKRGVQAHTYAAAGTYQVTASPVASACMAPSAPVPVTVA